MMLLPVLLAADKARASEFQEWGPFIIQRYMAADGLVSSEVTGSYIDSRGFIWIATFNGISRFDGHQFDNYGRESGLAESNTAILGEDDAGDVFAQSIAHVYRFSGNGKTAFVRYPADGSFIAAAAPQGAGQVWVAYAGRPGIHLLSEQNTVRKLATATPVLSLVRGKDKVVYGLEESGRLFAIFPGGAVASVSTLVPHAPYINEGIRLFSDASNAVRAFAANNAYAYRLERGRIADSMLIPAATDWWQWTAGATGTLYHTPYDGTIAAGAHGGWSTILGKAQIKGSIYDIREGVDGSLWVSTSNGLLHIRRKQYRSTPAQSPLAYFASAGMGGMVLCSDSQLYRIPGAVAAYKRLEPQTITSLYVTRAKEVWYTTETSVYYLPYGKSLQRLTTGETYAGRDVFFRFRRVLEDTAGGIWISSYHGVFYWKNGRLSYYFDREGITEGALYTMVLDRRGTCYVAGIHVFAFTGRGFRDISKSLGLPDEISRLATDRDGAVWVSQSTDKLVRIGHEGNRFFAADSLRLSINGLPLTATSICFDTAANLWVCDDKSLYCYRAGGAGVNAASPLFWNEQLSGSPLLYPGSYGTVQVLSHPLSGNYLRSYDAAVLLRRYNRQTPHVVLTAIRLNKAPFDWQGAGYTIDPLGIPQRLSLQYNQNFLRFHFSGLLPDAGRAVAYRYRLRGYDDEWSPVTAMGIAEYTGLPPGSYTFEAAAISAGSDWSRPLQYRFFIKAVWYKRWWAITCWLLLGAALIAGLIYLRWRTVSQRARLKQLLAEEQLKALRAQINPHFLQNTFAFLAHEIYGRNPERAVKALDRISRYLRDVLNVSDKTWLSLEEELDFAEQYMLMQELLLSTHFNFGFHVDEEVDTFDTRVPSMLLQPVLENALKYGIRPNGENKIIIRIGIEGDYVKIVVSDTGGAPQPGADKGRQGKGILLTTQRLTLFYDDKTARPSISREPNAWGGTDVIILLPVR